MFKHECQRYYEIEKKNKKIENAQHVSFTRPHVSVRNKKIPTQTTTTITTTATCGRSLLNIQWLQQFVATKESCLIKSQ